MRNTLTPKEIVKSLQRYIIGQEDALRAVAIAARNNWRRSQVEMPLRMEIKPKNLLMIGPTGVGKTEIARRLAQLVDAPFIKVEATKFTEVGYVGRDVESMVRDLVDTAIKQEKEIALTQVSVKAREAAIERVLDVLLTPARNVQRTKVESVSVSESPLPQESNPEEQNHARLILRRKLEAGEMNEKEIEIQVSSSPIGVEIMAPPGMEEMTSQLQTLFQSMGSDRSKKKKMTVKEALRIAQEEEANKLVDDEKLKAIALEKVEQNGIIFIDEIDKIAKRGTGDSSEVSREGVQRDLLPLIEGCTVFTKYGMVKTDHILFIASGAFHLAKPSELIPELQGRLPIRVELMPLTVEDFIRILTETDASLTEQYRALLATEGVELEFKKDGVKRIAEIAWQVNENTENIGARRLHTVMEKLVEPVSFDASDLKRKKVVIDAKYVNDQLGKLASNRDLSEYIL